MHLLFINSAAYLALTNTRPKPVEHGYLFSMAVGTIGDWLKLVPFLLWEEQLILRGGGGGGGEFFKKNFLPGVLGK